MLTDQQKRAARLRQARVKAGFEDAADAAQRFGWPVIAYRSHENGIRGMKPTVAKKYANAFKCSWGWLMSGEGSMTGPGIDAEIMALPEEMQEPAVEALRSTLKALKIRAKAKV